MTKEQSLHPELGSGALREALEQIASITCSCHDSADANWHGKRCPKGIALAALSLSSPIEPAQITVEQSERLERLCKQTRAASKAKLGSVVIALDLLELLLARPTPQASSEIRELPAAWRERAISWRSDADLPKLTTEAVARGWEDAADELESALSPSRQGAGGK